MKKQAKTATTRGTQKKARKPIQPDSRPEAVIKHVEALLSKGVQEQILPTLAPITLSFPFDDALLNGRFLRLLAFAYAHGGHLADAEHAAVIGQLLFPEALDFPFVLCSVKLALKDPAGARASGERFLQLRESKRGQALNNDELNTTGSQTGDIYLWLGVASKMSGDVATARKFLETAINQDKGSQSAYIELATMLRSTGLSAEAKRIVDQGCKCCRDVAELRLLAEAFKPHPTVTACMIVKNEEELLPGCLDSIRNWVDEIIIVDTGSTDQTISIAQAYGARVFNQPWEGDFSKHRNYSLDQATGDWVFIIDADERILQDDLPTLKQVLADSRHAAVALSVYNVYEGKQTQTFLPSIRFFRRSLNLRYDGIVHNTLVYPSDLAIARVNVRLNHLGYGLGPEKMRQKLNRTKELLHKQLAENPSHAFGWFNLAQALRGEAAAFDEDTSREVIEAATKALSLTRPDDASTRHIHLMSLDQLAWAHFGRGAYEKALSYAQQAIAIKSNYLDPLLLIGHIYARQQRFAEADRAYRKYLEVQARYHAAEEVDNIIFLHLDSRASAHFALGAIAELRGETRQAIAAYGETAALTNDHLDVHERLAKLYLTEGALIEAEAAFNAHLSNHADSVESRLGLAYIKWALGDLTSAERLYLEVLEMQPGSFVAASKLCRLYLELGHSGQTMILLDQARSIAAQSSGNEQELARLLFAAGRYAEATEWYEKAIAIRPNDAALYNDLGNCFYKIDRLVDAERCYLKSLNLADPEDITWRNLALARVRLNDPLGAAEALRQFTDHHPREVEHLLMLADMYSRGGDFGASISTYERYLLANPGDPQAIFGLSESYLAMGHRDSALMGYRRVLQLDPDFGAAKKRLRELEGAPQPA